MVLYDLKTLPTGAQTSKVVAEVRSLGGRECLWVALPPDIREKGIPDVDYIDTENFVVLPEIFSTGVLEVDIFTTLAPDATSEDRGFSGLAYHIDQSLENFESVYIRGTNGLKENPPQPRNARGIQYFAFPSAKFDYLRTNFPGVYEAPANLGLNEWISLRLEVDDSGVKAYVNEDLALVVEKSLCKANTGRVGLRVDIGTEAYFSNLRISKFN